MRERDPAQDRRRPEGEGRGQGFLDGENGDRRGDYRDQVREYYDPRGGSAREGHVPEQVGEGDRSRREVSEEQPLRRRQRAPAHFPETRQPERQQRDDPDDGGPRRDGQGR